jgi:hypothetical protein
LQADKASFECGDPRRRALTCGLLRAGLCKQRAERLQNGVGGIARGGIDCAVKLRKFRAGPEAGKCYDKRQAHGTARLSLFCADYPLLGGGNKSVPAHLPMY